MLALSPSAVKSYAKKVSVEPEFKGEFKVQEKVA